MNAALNGLGSQLFGWFGQLSIELAALAVLVLVASRLLPIKSPALRHLLWAVVLLKPLVAVAISSPYSLFTPLVPSVDTDWNALAFSPVDHPTVQVAAPPTIATSSVRLTTAGWGAILWLVGAALLIGRILIGYGIVWCLRQQAQVQWRRPPLRRPAASTSDPRRLSQSRGGDLPFYRLADGAGHPETDHCLSRRSRGETQHR